MVGVGHGHGIGPGALAQTIAADIFRAGEHVREFRETVADIGERTDHRFTRPEVGTPGELGLEGFPGVALYDGRLFGIEKVKTKTVGWTDQALEQVGVFLGGGQGKGLQGGPGLR